MANRSGAVLTLNHNSRFVRDGSVTQARALKVSDLTGATGNRCGSNRYLKRSAGAGVRLPGRVAELCHASPLRLRMGRHQRYPVSPAAARRHIQPPSSRFYENVTSTNAERSAARKLPAAEDTPGARSFAASSCRTRRYPHDPDGAIVQGRPIAWRRRRGGPVSGPPCALIGDSP